MTVTVTFKIDAEIEVPLDQVEEAYCLLDELMALATGERGQPALQPAGEDGEYPFVCHFCGKGYKKQAYLVKHLRRVHSVEGEQLRQRQCEHGNSPLACAQCDEEREALVDAIVDQAE